MSIPIIFVGRLLRSGIHYRNLRDHYFAKDDIIWLCNEISQQQYGISPQQIGRNLSAFCNRYSLSRQCVSEWLILQSFGFEQHSCYCTPDTAAVDTIGLIEIFKFESIQHQIELETAEAYEIRSNLFHIGQENSTALRRKIAFDNQIKRLKFFKLRVNILNTHPLLLI